MRRLVFTAALIVTCGLSLWAADTPKDTPAAAATRKKLQAKISVDFKDTRLEDAMKEIQDKVKDVTGQELSIKLDNVGGVSNNLTVTYSAKDKTVAEIFDEMFAKNDMGYIVISKEYKTYKSRYDGWVLIVKGKERGYPAGAEPTAKEEPKEKPDPKAGTKDKPMPSEKPAEDPEKNEKAAAAALSLAKRLAAAGQIDKAKERYKQIIKEFPNTKAAEEARELLKK
ncbi:MAG: hypothetical protein NZ700_08445 [Gemmataceae bacterium]|nr:hypothetical protein [Gemmataceae bacterium]MDW8267303.1 hypothetical protein [Gemmataceae bacterium]